MGRIKSTLIKRAAKNLLSENLLTEDFEHNKKVLGNSLPDKTTRNKVAGYIARLIVMQKEEKVKREKPKEEDKEDDVPQYERY